MIRTAHAKSRYRRHCNDSRSGRCHARGPHHGRRPRGIVPGQHRSLGRQSSRLGFCGSRLRARRRRRLDEELAHGHDRGPLHGIPLGIKDIYDVFDWPTAAGSKRWEHSIARQDSDVVGRLRTSGAVFLGKTVTTQYASFDPPVTCNPWNFQRTPGGSSSGSAAALATGMCLGALGSQTGGSITRPASYCGVAGCKPTYGRVPLDGIVPLAFSMDHPGPMAHCAARSWAPPARHGRFLAGSRADCSASIASSSRRLIPRLGRPNRSRRDG